jgi:choline dehydrogenase-like flavoprotein
LSNSENPLGSKHTKKIDERPEYKKHEEMEIGNPSDEQVHKLSQVEWDVIVVGSGAAGSVVAAQLGQKNAKIRILVIEMGHGPEIHNPLIKTPGMHEMLWDHPLLKDTDNPSLGSYSTTKQQTRFYEYPRGLIAGGSTAHHSLIDGRGCLGVYDEIAQLIGDPRWNAENVLKICKEMESYNVPETKSNSKFHGKSGWLKVQRSSHFPPIQRAFAKAAIDVTKLPFQKDLQGDPKDCVGVGEADLQINSKGERSYSYKDLLSPFLAQERKKWNPQKSEFPRVVVLFRCLVKRCNFEKPVSDVSPKAGTLRAVSIDVIPYHRYAADKSYRSDRDPTVFACQSSSPSSPQETKFMEDKPDRSIRFFLRPKSGLIVLSAGAIETPHILLLSGIGPQSDLQSHHIPVLIANPHVGQHLQDHHEVGVNFEVDSSKWIWGFQAAMILDMIQLLMQGNLPQVDGNPHFPSPTPLPPSEREYFLTNPKVRSELQSIALKVQRFADREEQKEGSSTVVLDCYSAESKINRKGSNKGLHQPDLHITSAGGIFIDFNFKCTDILANGKRRLDFFLSQWDPRHPDFLRCFHRFLIESLDIHEAKGSITLQSTNPETIPNIDLRLYEDAKANRILAQGVLLIREIVKQPYLRDFYLLDAKGIPIEIFPGSQYETVDQLADYMAHWSAFGHHMAGTARVAKNRQDGVCDSEFKVFGTSNLFIVDASVYPTTLLHRYNPSRGVYIIAYLAASSIQFHLQKAQ